MSSVPAIYTDAYRFAVREWRALSLPAVPSPSQYEQLQTIIMRYLRRRYPRTALSVRRAAASYGAAQAARDLGPVEETVARAEALAAPGGPGQAIRAWSVFTRRLGVGLPLQLVSSARYRQATAASVKRIKGR